MLGTLIAAFLVAAPNVEVISNPFASAYGVLRAQAEKPDTPPAPLADGVNKLRAIEATFPDKFKQRSGADVSGNRERTNGLYWRAIDGYIFAATSVDTLKASEPSLPAQTGGNLDTKATIEAIAAAIQPALDAKSFDAQNKGVDDALAYYKSTVEPKLDSVLDTAMAKFNLAKAPKKIRVLIVPDAGGKEAIAFKGGGGQAIAVGAGKFGGGDFAEVLIHEVLHEVIDSNKNSGFFADLETNMKGAGIKEEEAQRTSHACIFVAAALLTRSNFDPSHIDLGERYGAYNKGMAKSHDLVAAPMKAFLDGQVDANTTIQAITTAAK